jgi:hypothetical protein
MFKVSHPYPAKLDPTAQEDGNVRDSRRRQQEPTALTAMMNTPFPDRWERPERILLAPAEPGDFAPLGQELACRGAEAVVADSIAAAGEAARAGTFDSVFVQARASAEATLLLLRLMTAEAPKARLILVVDPAEAETCGSALMEAEEAMSTALSPRRMADAAGVGFHRTAAFA